jgi:hypothetical protein
MIVYWLVVLAEHSLFGDANQRASVVVDGPVGVPNVTAGELPAPEGALYDH